LGRFGRWLRASGLDELPQLVNVLRGEMCLVGPRPLPCDYTPLFSATEAERLRVRPGLVGLAQARGRNALPWAHRLGFDVQYARQDADFMTDLKIIFACCALLLRGNGATMPGHATSARLDESLMQDATTMRAGGKG
ncbi:MAG: sugar transferase, partial [Alphaproteobacteria bacterium]